MRRNRRTPMITRQARRGASATASKAAGPALNRDGFVSYRSPLWVQAAPRRSFLNYVEDNRQWNPSYNRIYTRTSRTFSGAPARLSASAIQTGHYAPGALYSSPVITFRYPSTVITCIRRKDRRESLFARGYVGTGKSVKRPRRNEMSSISCRG